MWYKRHKNDNKFIESLNLYSRFPSSFSKRKILPVLNTAWHLEQMQWRFLTCPMSLLNPFYSHSNSSDHMIHQWLWCIGFLFETEFNVKKSNCWQFILKWMLQHCHKFPAIFSYFVQLSVCVVWICFEVNCSKDFWYSLSKQSWHRIALNEFEKVLVFIKTRLTYTVSRVCCNVTFAVHFKENCLFLRCLFEEGKKRKKIWVASNENKE